MKKILLLSVFVTFVVAGNAFALSPTYSNPTESTINFYPMMRRQMEQDVTLDFENKPEEYKQKRTRKEAEAQYRAGNKNFNPSYNVNTSFTKFRDANKKKEFTTDSNGNIIIKDVQ